MSDRCDDAQSSEEKASHYPSSGRVLVLWRLCRRMSTIRSAQIGLSGQSEHIGELEAQRYGGIFQARDEKPAPPEYQAALRRRVKGKGYGYEARFVQGSTVTCVHTEVPCFGTQA